MRSQDAQGMRFGTNEVASQVDIPLALVCWYGYEECCPGPGRVSRKNPPNLRDFPGVAIFQQQARAWNFTLPDEHIRMTQSVLTVAGLLQQDSAGRELQCSRNRI